MTTNLPAPTPDSLPDVRPEVITFTAGTHLWVPSAAIYRILVLQAQERYLVSEKAHADRHYCVDLTDLGGYGSCTCEAFLRGYDPEKSLIALLAEAGNRPEGWGCKHLRLLWNALGKWPDFPRTEAILAPILSIQPFTPEQLFRLKAHLVLSPCPSLPPKPSSN